MVAWAVGASAGAGAAGARGGTGLHAAAQRRQPRLRAGDRRDAVEAEPVELAVVAAHARQPGLQPARPDRSHQRRQAEDGVGARHGRRQHGIDAARLRRRDVRAGPGRLHPGDQRQDRRPASGRTAASCRKACAAAPTATSPSGARRSSTPAPTTRCTPSTPRTGSLVWETKVLDATARASASSGPIIANGKVIEGRQCQPQAGNDACVVTAHDAKTGKELWRTRTIPLPGELGYDTWGDVPMAERWHVGTWMVPSYDPETNTDLRRHVGDDSGAEVHARRQRQEVPVPQLDAGDRRRHRQDQVALPARGRSLGSRSPVRAAAGRDRGVARSEGSAVDQPEDQAGRTPQGDDRHSRQDRPGLHARSADRRVPLGAPHRLPERHHEDRRRHRRGHGQPGEDCSRRSTRKS